MIVTPVLNGKLPRIDGGVIDAILSDPELVHALPDMGTGTHVLMAPYVSDTGALYPAGLICEIRELWVDQIYVNAPPLIKTKGLFCRLVGRSYARARSFDVSEGLIVAEGLEPLDLDSMRSEYPCISGAGWQPEGGFTEARGADDISVTIYGRDLLSGASVSITGEIGALVSEEQAHTIEHAIIRALSTSLLVTPKTLFDCLQREAMELKASIDIGMELELPEVFGVTQSGSCGNPLTNLARIYLWDELIQRIEEGQSPWISLQASRRKTLSRLSRELELTNDAGLRTLQALKKGMKHQDTAISPTRLAEIIRRFPLSPWH
ncbi:MAG: hypothetical protein ACM3ZQ_06120 [Bacillota bacterium]